MNFDKLKYILDKHLHSVTFDLRDSSLNGNMIYHISGITYGVSSNVIVPAAAELEVGWGMNVYICFEM